MLLLLSCWIIAGISAEDLSKRHYRVKNSSLCVQVKISSPPIDDRWSFNDKFIIFNKNITPGYTDKVNYSSRDLMLCINKLTEEDSGIYKVVITYSNFITSTESHRLIVQETVPRPVIRMSVIHSNLSAGFCNVTVNCSVHDEWMYSVCDEDDCRTTQRSFREVNITVFTHNRSIGCRGNNHVSKSDVFESMEAMCFSETNREHEDTSQQDIIKLITSVTAVCVFVFCVFIACVAKVRFSAERNHHQTRLIQSQLMDAQPQPVRRDSSFTSSDAEASYENVDATQPDQTSGPREESKQSQKIDTVYCVLEVPNVAGKSDGSKAAKEPKNIPEASTSQPVTPGGEEHPAQIHTVYKSLHHQ